jgi:ribulose-phosphate 3-epimerase
LWIDASLWSADLTALGSEVKRLEPYVDSFHFDVADSRFVPVLLFFPELLKQVRPLTRRPFHVHLLVERPQAIVDEFLAAGANWVTVPLELGEVVGEIVDRVPSAGVSLNLDTPIGAASRWLPRLHSITMMGTPLGVKGCELDSRACGRIAAVRQLIGTSPVRIFADGGIRANTVAALREAGADAVVAGSLICAAPDLPGTARWLQAL